MGIFDWILLIVIAFFAVRGWMKGLVGMLLQLVGLILVFFLIAHYLPLVKAGLMLRLHLGSILSTILAVILIAAVILLISKIILILIEKTLKLMHLSTLNSALGALTGLLVGLFCVVVLTVILDYFPSLTKPLENPNKHKVYAAVIVVRGELYSAFKIKPHLPKPEELLDKALAPKDKK